MPRIEEVARGQAPTLLKAEKANQLIKAVNALLNLVVKPDGAGKMVAGADSAVLDLSPIASVITKAVMDQVVNTYLNNINTQISNLQTSVTNLTTSVTSLQTSVTTITNRLDAASISGSGACNEDGTTTISVTLSL